MPTLNTLEQRFVSFFQAFWLAPVTAERDRLIGFRGTGPAFSAVIREVGAGRPLANFRVEVPATGIELDLRAWMTGGSIVLDLFGTQADSDRYFAESVAGWTAEERAILADPALLHMIPDVSFTPQNAIRASRHRCDPRDPQSVAIMNAEVRVIYGSFTRYDGHVLPSVNAPELRGLLIAAPGNPPEWIPPD